MASLSKSKVNTGVNHENAGKPVSIDHPSDSRLNSDQVNTSLNDRRIHI